jgi:hypothetical protein
LSVLAEYNAARALTAATRDAAVARSLIDRGGLSRQQAAVAGARWSHPDWSWGQVAASLGLSKDQAVGTFRRLAVKAGLR